MQTHIRFNYNLMKLLYQIIGLDFPLAVERRISHQWTIKHNDETELYKIYMNV